ncbi:hypothetical protein [Hyphococcus sp.]|uniref:hypothetical protein n=1 Tax=Hyphococcus sp. TaxID=2038636 RepID=UPI003D12F700
MTTMPQHRDFALWYSQVDLGEDPSRIKNRWAGVAKLLEGIDYKGCGKLVDVFLRRPGAVESEGGELLRAPFTETDPNFLQQGNTEELTLLAEIVLAVVLDKQTQDELAGWTATLIYSALAGGAVSAQSKTDLLSRAESAMRLQGRLVRERSPLPDEPKSYVPPLDFADCIADDVNPAALDQFRTVMGKVAAKTAKTIGAIARQARNERTALMALLEVQDEELDLLWWASNGQSETTGKMFSEMNAADSCLLAAVEAANRTQFEPAPAAIHGLLLKAGLSAALKLSIADAINACDVAWLRKISIADATTRTPLHFGIAQRLQSPESNAWSAHWEAITKIDGSSQRSALDITHLFYQERLVLDAFGSVQ